MKDADFVVELGDVFVGAIAAALGGDYRLDPQMSFERIDVQGANLDLACIRHWCDQHGTRELFEQLLAGVQQH